MLTTASPLIMPQVEPPSLTIYTPPLPDSMLELELELELNLEMEEPDFDNSFSKKDVSKKEKAKKPNRVP